MTEQRFYNGIGLLLSRIQRGCFTVDCIYAKFSLTRAALQEKGGSRERLLNPLCNGFLQVYIGGAQPPGKNGI